MKIKHVNTDATKGTLPVGTLGYDAYVAGGDEGRVGVGTASGNVLLAKKSEVDLKAPLASPTLTGVPAAPTAPVGTNTTQLATTAFVQAEIAEVVTKDVGELYAQHGLIPTDGVNEIRPQDMFTEMEVADVLVDKKGYPVRFTDGVYERLGKELVTNGNFAEVTDGEVGYDNGDGTVDGWTGLEDAYISILNNSIKVTPIINPDCWAVHNMQVLPNSIYAIEYEAETSTLLYNSIWIGNSQASQSTTNGRFYFTSTAKTKYVKYIQTSSSQTYLSFGIFAGTLGSWVKVSNISVKELPQFSLPKAPFATGSTDELLDDKVNGLTTQSAHSKSDIVVAGNRQTLPTGGLVTISIGDLVLYSGGGLGGIATKTYLALTAYTDIDISTIDFTNVTNFTDKGVYSDSYIALQDTTAGALLSDTTKFKAIPYVTKQVALLIEKTSAGTVLNTVKPLVSVYGEESVETYEADIFSELGYSQVSDRVYTDGSSEFILVGLKGYANSGSYDYLYNPFGSRKYADNNFWYATTSGRTSVYDSFLNRSTATTSGRPDSKVANYTYINGQSGLICYAIPNAKTPTYKHLEEIKRNLVDGYVENGVEIKKVLTGLYYSNENSIHAYFRTEASGGGSVYPLFANDYYTERPCTIIQPSTGKVLDGTISGADGYIRLGIDRDGLSTYVGGHTTGLGLTSTDECVLLIRTKSPYLATQGTATTTVEALGNPTYFSTDMKSLLASGDSINLISNLVDDSGNNNIPDGIKTVFKMNKKFTSALQVLKSTDSGVTWTSLTLTTHYTINTVANTITFVTAPLATDLILVSEATANQSAVSITTPKKIEYVDRDLIASNHHSVYAYNGLTYASSGKVATGSAVESKGVEDVVELSYTYDSEDNVLIRTGDCVYCFSNPAYPNLVGNIYLRIGANYSSVNPLLNENYGNTSVWLNIGKYLAPTHSTLTLDANSIVGSKALVTQTASATQVFTQEMVYNVDWGDTDEFDALVNTTTTNLNGDIVQHKVLLKPSSCKIGE